MTRLRLDTFVRAFPRKQTRKSLDCRQRHAARAPDSDIRPRFSENSPGHRSPLFACLRKRKVKGLRPPSCFCKEMVSNIFPPPLTCRLLFTSGRLLAYPASHETVGSVSDRCASWVGGSGVPGRIELFSQFRRHVEQCSSSKEHTARCRKDHGGERSP